MATHGTERALQARADRVATDLMAHSMRLSEVEDRLREAHRRLDALERQLTKRVEEAESSMKINGVEDTSAELDLRGMDGAGDLPGHRS